MGKGKGKEINLDFILRVAELILLIIAIVMFLINSGFDSFDNFEPLVLSHLGAEAQNIDAMCLSCSIYIIILIILLGMKFIKGEELDQKFVGTLSGVGAILTIVSGFFLCIRGHTDNIMISGIMAIFGGAALVVESLKDYQIF